MPPVETLAWWPPDLDEAERARRAIVAQKQIAELPGESYRRDRDLFNIRLYENNPVITLYTFAGKYYSDAATLALPPPEQSVNNKAKAAIDTLAAQIASTDQRARFLVVDGESPQRRRSRKMQNFTDGLVHELKLHPLKQRIFLDAAILESGKGAIQFYRDGDRCAAQRALATEFSIDPLDGLVDGQPRTLYRRRPMPRDEVHNSFGGDERSDGVIENAKPVSAGGAPGDHIEVFESWHLPTKEDSSDGWHIVGLDTPEGWLETANHKKPYHDVVFFGLEDKFTTSWGLSLMTQMRPLQVRINANTYRAERSLKLFHAGHLYVNKTMQMNKATFSNEIGTVWEGNGDQPPQQIMFQAINNQLLEEIERDGQRIFDNHGISVSASQGETNAGLNASAASKREDTAKSDKRNAVRQQRWENFHLDCVKVALSIVRDIVENDASGKTRKSKSGYKVAAPGQRGLTVSDWKDAALDEDQYVMQIRPASPIPSEPAGLVAFGERMVEVQAWSPQKLAGYMQDLDADGRTNRDMAKERQLEKVFEKLLYDKVAAAMPDEFTDLDMALDIGTEYLAQGEDDGVSEKNLERVRRYLKRCKAMGAAAQAASAPPPTPPGAGAPPAPPPGAPPP